MINVARGGEFTLEVNCDRHGYDGPIELSIDGAGEGWKLKEETIPKSKKSTQLKMTAAPLLLARSVFRRS